LTYGQFYGVFEQPHELPRFSIALVAANEVSVKRKKHKELKELLRFLASASIRTRELFFSYANEGPEMKADIDALTRALRSRPDASLRWDSAV